MHLSFLIRSFLMVLMAALPVLADQAPASFDMTWELAQAKKPTRSSAKPTPVTEMDGPGGLWLRTYSGIDLSFLKDLDEGTKNFEKLIEQAGYYADSHGSSVGLLLGTELGASFGDGHGLSLAFEGVLSSTYSLVSITPIGAMSFRFEPSLYSASLNYHLDLGSGPGHRTVLTLGAGYYMAIVNYAGIAIPMPVLTEAELTGSAPGATLGITQEWKVDGALSVEASARFRWADITRVEASRLKVDGSETETDVALARGEMVPGQEVTLLFDKATIDSDSTLEYAHADFSGLDLAFNLKLAL
jgi:hypothetical protein